jgi:hypothetical protein
MRLEQEIVESILVTLRRGAPSTSARGRAGISRSSPARVRGTWSAQIFQWRCCAERQELQLQRGLTPASFSPGQICHGGQTPACFLARPKSGLGQTLHHLWPGRKRHGVRPSGLRDARRLPFARRSFDLVNASLTVGDVVDLQTWTAEMARVLGRGGHLVYSDFHPSWTQHGWKRTFRDRNGETHELAFAAHSIDDHLAALEAAGLRAAAIREPRFKDDSDPAVKEFRRRWRNPPVVVVFHAVKQP